MSGLEEKENKLKTLCRRISAKMSANPINILNNVEMVPLYLDTEKQLVALLVELDVGLQEIFEEHAVELGETKINSWKAKLQAVKNNFFKYRQDLAVEVKNVRQAYVPTVPNPLDSLSQTRPVPSSANSSLEQDRLDREKEKGTPRQEVVAKSQV